MLRIDKFNREALTGRHEQVKREANIKGYLFPNSLN